MLRRAFASRIAYGVEATPDRLRVVEQGEEALRALGFAQFRVRHHDQLVRIEIAPDELPRALDPLWPVASSRSLSGLAFSSRHPRSRRLPSRFAELRPHPDPRS